MADPPSSAPFLALPSRWRAGTLIGERYRLLERIGAGAIAEVWRAEHAALQTAVALKLVSIQGQSDAEQLLARFVEEARAAAELRSPHVVQILDQGVMETTGYIAMELLEGESLFQRLGRQPVLGPGPTARIISQMALALDLAHDMGIIHRDLKPQNIFLANDGGREVLKLLDFGVAKRMDFRQLDVLATQDGMMVGTPAYMSPEQIMGNRPVDRRSDVWQMGVIAFECLCGRRPFDGEAVGELMVRICSDELPVPSDIAPVPNGFDQCFAQSTARDPDERFATASELAEAMCAVLVPGASWRQLTEDLPPWQPAPAAVLVSAPSHPGQVALDGAWAPRPARARPASAVRALVLAMSIAVPVAMVAVVIGLWLTSRGATQAPPPDESLAVPPGSALPSAPPFISPLATVARDGGAAEATTDAGADARAQPDAAPSAEPGPDELAPTPTWRSRPARPEEILGI